ncbi:hypothetical protein N7539_006863 [Penicillium diatomitis]|uniref:F-box domain-containing protein n=1 Tax=Penicillium diatomitis TaxID=2819901 RepID=A0A9W9X1Z0_9EURO|nr:uncharacterized protein N7539_006863 [Penicillium diatomitis]KAJ5480969.1 hypothetical protein N7539_006863 [Penicillium diatomitis]
MSHDLWISLASAIHPSPNSHAMSAVLQSTIHLLESELAKARAALQEIHPHAPLLRIGDEVAVGAMAAYRQHLINQAPDFYGSRRLTAKEIGLEPVVRELPIEEHDPVESLTQQTQPPPKQAPLENALSNSLILDHMAPYLGPSSLLTLASTSRHLSKVITTTPYVFRHLDLTRCRGAQLSTAEPSQDADTQTEDEIYSAPLRKIFGSLEKRSLLQDVRTLILDGLSVPADLVADIILTDRFNVNILSIRECQHLNERKLMQVIQHAVRPTRPQGTPKVKAIYHFSPMHTPPRAAVRRQYRDWWGSRLAPSSDSSRSSSNTSSDNDEEVPQGSVSPPKTANAPAHLQSHGDEWYRASGRIFKHGLVDGWAQTLQKCEGLIAFDAVLCRGPRHDVDRYTNATETNPAPEGRLLGPAIASVALGPRGCDGCHSSPEGPAIWGQSSDEHFPLLSPIPVHVSHVAAAKRPVLIPGEYPVLIARCADCLTDRWCHRCNKWFCSNCLPHPTHVRTTLTPHQTAIRSAHPTLHGAAGSPHVEREVWSYPSSMAKDSDHGEKLTFCAFQRIEQGVSKDCWECGPTVRIRLVHILSVAGPEKF